MKLRFLVVVEPTHDRHYALERAIALYQDQQIAEHLTVFIGVNPQSTSTTADNPALYKDREWFLDLLRPLDECGVDYTVRASWSSEWQESILRMSEDDRADMILVPVRERAEDMAGGLLRFSDAKWALLRRANCPVLLVQPGAVRSRNRVIAAVRSQDRTEDNQALNQRILDAARNVAEAHGAELHVVNAYRDQNDYPDRGALIRQADLPNQRVHVKEGAADAVIAAVAQEIEADLVVIGTRRRRGFAALRGNTSEKVISALTQDVLTIN